MREKEKSKQIYDLFDGPISDVIVKEHTFKCINLLIEASGPMDDVGPEYWENVKTELINLIGDYYDNKK